MLQQKCLDRGKEPGEYCSAQVNKVDGRIYDQKNGEHGHENRQVGEKLEEF